MFYSPGVVTFADGSYFSARESACAVDVCFLFSFTTDKNRFSSEIFPLLSLALHLSHLQRHPGTTIPRRQSGLLNSLASFCTEDFACTSPRSFLLGFRAIKVNSRICQERFLSKLFRNRKRSNSIFYETSGFFFIR